MKIIERFFDWLVDKVYDIKLETADIEKQYGYLEFQNDVRLKKYISMKALELAESEDVPVKFIDDKTLNKDAPYEKRAAGVFYALYEGRAIKFKNGEWQKYPYIAITEKGDIWTLLHELGHYFIEKDHLLQSEEGADYYIEKFFDDHLPEFFKWVFQIRLNIHCETNRKFTKQEYVKYYDECKKFLLETPIQV